MTRVWLASSNLKSRLRVITLTAIAQQGPAAERRLRAAAGASPSSRGSAQRFDQRRLTAWTRGQDLIVPDRHLVGGDKSQGRHARSVEVAVEDRDPYRAMNARSRVGSKLS